MSGKASTLSQVISLPKGGGALHGIGEKFSPDLHTGTGNFSVPIALPPGRNGFQPQLNLSYSTGNGNGPYGLGWSLSIPGVSRKTSHGLPRYDNSRDVFILSGAEDLVPVERKPGLIRYQPRTEGLFARIVHHQDASTNYWEVKSKDGLVSLYGTPGATGKDPAAVANPTHRSHIFTWKLTRTTDPFGNRIDYLYERDAVQTDGPHQWDQLYLSEIRYADYGDRTNPKFLVRVKFTYENRPDPFSDYRAGFEIRTVRRCTRIEVFTQPGEEILARTYHLVYLDQRGLPAEQLPHNGVSLLSQVRVQGHDGPSTEQLPPLEFNYTRFEPGKRGFFPVTGPAMPPGSLARPEYELVDLFGNGLPDILELNGTVRYWRNLGQGRFDLPREMREAPAGLRLADPDVQLIDADGDGRTDLLVTRNGLSGYFPLRFGGLWDRRSFQRYKVAPSFNLEDPEVKLVDLTGDGVTDALRSGSRLECFFNDPQQGWQETRWVERHALEMFPNINFSDPRVKWGDMSGEGLQDIMLVYDGNIEYWPNLGYGNWGKRISMRNSPRFPYGYDPRRILVGDVDGDGLADLVYVDDKKVCLWINQGGNGWSEPIEIQGIPPISDLDAVRLEDLLGTGVQGVLWSRDAGGLSHQSMFFLDFTGGVKPYLLNEMDNHLGALTRIEYAPSTRFYLEDVKRLETRWKTPLPFPVQVVAKVEVIDQISKGKLTTEYRYHHGYWDGAEREFRGFGRVDQRDTEVFEAFNTPGLHGPLPFEQVEVTAFSPPLETRTWFHQGPVGDEFGDWEEQDFSHEFWSGDSQLLSRPPSMTTFLKALPRRVKRDALRTLRGSVLRTELYALDGTDHQDRPYTVTESLQGVREEASPAAGEPERKRIFFSFALAARTRQWERGNDPLTQFTFTGDYDEYGQLLLQASMAVPRGRDSRVAASPGEPYLVTLAMTTYAQRDDADHYIVDRVACATTFEILNDGSPSVFQLWETTRTGAATQRLLGQTLNFYDGTAFQGLSLGQIGDYGALVRTENLVLTPDILHEGYKSGSAVANPPEIPPYLRPGGAVAWTAEYPQEFRDRLPALAGYTHHTGGPGAEDTAGYFSITGRRRYDFHDDPRGRGRGLITIERDPLGLDTTISYDAHELLPVKVTDPTGLVTSAIYDYRLLQPREVTDANGNRTAYTFTPLGLLASTAVMGKVGEVVGDTPAAPGVRLVYDLLAFTGRRQPVSVRTVRRVHHTTDADIPLPDRDETIETVEFSDGFGRLLQSRTQAEDITFGDSIFGDAGLPADQALSPGEATGRERALADPLRVVVSGWQIYDNKGRVVEKFEPFFSTGWDYTPPTNAQRGQKVKLHYDPRGQVIRTINPDESEQWVVYGVPFDLSNPEQFTPTPWEAYTYDANDNAGRTHATVSGVKRYQQHWNTPTSIVIDALGRVVEAIERNGPNPATDWFVTRSTYDIRGNLLAVTDALGRVAFRYLYDLANQRLRIESIDAGVRRTLLDAAGNLIEQRDSKEALVLRAYDILRRPIRLWARDGAGQKLTLRERMVYGDSSESGLTAAQARTANLLGKLYRHYDEAGLLMVEHCDFKGNVLEKIRQVINDAAILAVFNPVPANWQVPAFRTDWQPPSGRSLENHANQLLDATVYRTSATYDALNRVIALQYPQDVEGSRKTLQPRYNRAGALEQIELDGKTYVERIAYNAKGQRTLIVYGNGLMTRSAYDPRTFRLVRLCTERFSQPTPLTYRPTGAPLQDYAYTYDLIGNILNLHDRTPASGVLNNPDATGMADPHLARLLAEGNALVRHFEYDPLYRLRSATGRECDLPPAAPPWEDRPRCTDLTRARLYTEQYQYDLADNLERLQHRSGSSGFTRSFTLAAGNNRLATAKIGATDFAYGYDANGNLLQENSSRHFEWDYSDRMRVYHTQADAAEPSVHAHYLYNAGGQRVKKLVRKQGGRVEVTIYIDDIFEHQWSVQGSSRQENNSLHVMDNQSRIALIRVGRPFADDTTPAVKFHLGDHLGSSNLVIDDAGALINREEYTPYGETSFGSFARKRYRFTGKERDEESGLNYHGARYYAPSLCRWLAVDPMLISSLSQHAPADEERTDGESQQSSYNATILRLNSYNYCNVNPLKLIDPDGKVPMPWWWVWKPKPPPPPPTPVDTHRLRQIARWFYGPGMGPLQFNRVAGRGIQEFVLRQLGFTENFTLFLSPVRQQRTLTSAVPRTHVMPDAVGPVLYIPRLGDPFSGPPRTYANSLFIEVKAVRGVIGLSHSNHQIAGFIDVLANSPAGQSTGPSSMPPTLLFVTTSDTIIGPDVLAEATRRGVGIWQATIYETNNPASGGTQLQIGPAIPLNPWVYTSRQIVPIPPGFSQPGTLMPSTTSGSPLDPDPAEVQ